MDVTVLQAVCKYDNPHFLDECLKSLYEQTLPAKKILIIKDGLLTPELEKTLEKWKAFLPLEIHGYEKNRGLAFALNWGIDYVQTELTARMDSDDICLKNRLEIQAEEFKKNPEIQILGSYIEEFFITSKKTVSHIREYPLTINKNSASLYKGTPLAHPSIMIRTEVYRKNKYFVNTKKNEDIALWFSLLKKGITLYNVNKALLKFRITEDSFKRRSIKKGLSEFFIYKRSLRKFNGFSFKEIYIWLRLFFRLLPCRLTKKIYLSEKRFIFFKHK